MIHCVKIACSSSVAENYASSRLSFVRIIDRSYVPCYTLVNVANTEKYVTFNHYRKTLQNYVEIPYVPLTPPNKGVKIKIKGKNCSFFKI